MKQSKKHSPPERYDSRTVLTTYIETGNLSIYCHGPTGIQPFEEFFTSMGMSCTTAFIKPFHWETLTHNAPHKTHILVMRNPLEQHHHGAYLHAISMRQGQQKRDNMFYHTHLQPHLPVIQESAFDFYISYENLGHYLPDWRQPAEPPYGETGKVVLFDISREINTYEDIKKDKMELQVPQWRELIIHGQLDEI